MKYHKAHITPMDALQDHIEKGRVRMSPTSLGNCPGRNHLTPPKKCRGTNTAFLSWTSATTKYTRCLNCAAEDCFEWIQELYPHDIAKK